ncbi:uncharacterized protein LOC131193143 [Ahaetulla prasina]|uniref:uncharacterized protein LOC131193143 n=1 Tax=Ahaetulla prasina TaxID=499056 RepID=UPI002647B484|nr:uncharacterized protein LOC131193143 [Ahaetulla prasina]
MGSSTSMVSTTFPKGGAQQFEGQGEGNISSPEFTSLWTSVALLQGCMFQEPDQVVLTMDASFQGWGAHLLSQVAQGHWSPLERANSINWLELRAVRLALHHFQIKVDRSACVSIDRQYGTKAHINREGGTRSRALMAEAERLMHWAEKHTLSVKMEYISGASSIKADWLSRARLDRSEWRLHPLLFQELSQRFEVPILDLFASLENTQLPRYFSRFRVPGAENYNALRCHWPRGLLYMFPLISLIPRVLRMLLTERAELLLVAPHWPHWSWFADLVSLCIPSREDSMRQDFAQPRGRPPSGAPMAPFNHLALERVLLSKANLSDKVIRTMQASRQGSTNRIYDAS